MLQHVSGQRTNASRDRLQWIRARFHGSELRSYQRTSPPKAWPVERDRCCSSGDLCAGFALGCALTRGFFALTRFAGQALGEESPCARSAPRHLLGVPCAITMPLLAPRPMSINRSADLITSNCARSRPRCCPRRRVAHTPAAVTSSDPVVGSSRMYSVLPVATFDSSVANFTRWPRHLTSRRRWPSLT